MNNNENQVTISADLYRSLVSCEVTMDILRVMLSDKYPDYDLMLRILGGAEKEE